MTPLQPYPAYKDSGVLWLGQVPEHWSVKRIRNLFRIVNGATPPTDNRSNWDGDIVWLTPEDLGRNQDRYIARSGRRITIQGYESCGTSLAPANSIAISTRAPIGHLAITSVPACINQGNRLLVSKYEINTAYWYFQLLTAKGWLQALGQGSTFAELSHSSLAAFAALEPPIPEQSAIVRYLDHVDRRIRRYVRARQKLIALLNEQRQAIIHRAVTRGLDPNVRLKPSGLQWLGDVPAHWEVQRLKAIVSRVTSGSRGWSNFAADDGPLFIRIANLTRASMSLDFSNTVRLDLPTAALSEAARTKVQANDILLSITAYIGSVGIVPELNEDAYVSQHVACCRPIVGAANVRWVGYVLLSPVAQTHGHLCMYGGTKQGLSLDDVKNYLVLLPPIEEQNFLVNWIETKTGSLDQAITTANKEIALLREYRTRLIADVVTGKLDVRAAAARLPDEADGDDSFGPETSDANELSDDTEESAVEAKVEVPE